MYMYMYIRSLWRTSDSAWLLRRAQIMAIHLRGVEFSTGPSTTRLIVLYIGGVAKIQKKKHTFHSFKAVCVCVIVFGLHGLNQGCNNPR